MITYWTREGKFEAPFYPDGTILHRLDGPAIEYPDGTKIWYVNSKTHRTDGPAIEYANGRNTWCVNGKLHRTDGPAIIDADGSKDWWINGTQHRTDGPAIEYANGRKRWFIYDHELSEEEHKAEVSKGEFYLRLKYAGLNNR